MERPLWAQSGYLKAEHHREEDQVEEQDLCVAVEEKQAHEDQ